MPLPRPSSPRAAFADLRAFFHQRGKHQLLAGGLALLLPGIILYGFHRDAERDMKPEPTLIFAESWGANRTDAEIIAQQKIDSERRAAAKVEKQRQYKELERRLGM